MALIEELAGLEVDFDMFPVSASSVMSLSLGLKSKCTAYIYPRACLLVSWSHRCALVLFNSLILV